MIFSGIGGSSIVGLMGRLVLMIGKSGLKTFRRMILINKYSFSQPVQVVSV